MGQGSYWRDLINRLNLFLVRSQLAWVAQNDTDESKSVKPTFLSKYTH